MSLKRPKNLLRDPSKPYIEESSKPARPYRTERIAPDGQAGWYICYRKRGYKRKDGTRKPNCPEGWHHHGPYLPIGQLGDEWFWKEPKT